MRKYLEKLRIYSKMLGVAVSNDLTWNRHVENIVSKAGKRLCICAIHTFIVDHMGFILYRYRSAFFSMKAAELKCQNLIVKKVCQVEYFKTYRKAIGPELGL